MIRYLVKRLGRSLFTLFIIISIVFILLRFMPIEGYFQNYDKLSEAQIQAGLQNMGLNDPVSIQLVHFYKNLLKGDLGTSRIYRSNVAVTEILAAKIPVSMKLGVMSVILAIVLGIPLGVLMASYKEKCWDKLGTGFIIFIQAVPAAIYYLFIQLYGTEWFHLHLLYDEGDITSWILPIISLSLN